MNVGFEDEMRIGLIPSTRRMWSKKDERSLAYQQNKYEWLYIYNVVFPFRRECFTLFMPTVNKECMEIYWNEFAKEYHDGEYLIIMDGAGFHQNLNPGHLDFIKFVKLPPYSPELNPAETIWKIYREFVANKCFNSLADLEQELIKAYRYIEANKTQILSRTEFHWIKEVATN